MSATLRNFKSLCTKNQKEIVCRDKKSQVEYRAENKSGQRVSQYQVDGQIITEGIRCDFLLCNEDGKDAYYIELKGSDVLHAKEQLLATQRQLRTNIPDYRSFYRIVYRTGTHSVGMAPIIGWRKKMGRIGKREVVIVKGRNLEENIN